MSDFYTEADLAEMLNATERRIGEWRRIYSWPHLRIGRTIRFTQNDVEQIVAKHAREAEAEPLAVTIAGQTKRSARRAG